MKIPGISGSPRCGRTADQLIQAVLSAAECETEFLSLAGLSFIYNQIECLGEVTATGPASCFTCGYGEDCKSGAIDMFFEAGTKITPEITPDLSKQPEKLEEARALGRKLSERLRGFAAAT